VELEDNKKINFLDITISRTNNALEFSIFRKPTYTDIIIPHNSCHPTEHKFASLRYFTNHLNTYQLNPIEKNNERLIIQNIAYNNGFPLDIVGNLMKKQPIHFKTTQGKSKDKKWVTLTFFGKETYYISKVFKHTSLQVAFKTKNSLQSLLNMKDKSEDIFSKSGIYQLTCNDCGKKIHRPNKPQLQKRCKEHLQSFKYNNQNSKFVQHAIETGHEFGKRNYVM
jgi:hypothetical protein